MIKTYRAKSLQEAIALIRTELGPDASVLHTREVGGGIVGRLLGTKRIEVAASADVQAPSRFDTPRSFVPPHNEPATEPHTPESFEPLLPAATGSASNARLPTPSIAPSLDINEAMFTLFTDLIEADIEESLARRLLDDLRRHAGEAELANADQLRSLLPQVIEKRFTTTGPINIAGGRRLVALVGPTGVGKTTTIAKLAANFRLKEKLRVGLITVDTYRVAAVEQLRTYADIIDLPMEVVSTPREMREAVDRLSHLDLMLLDTAGRSPRDEVRIQELRSMLAEAQPDEVHLVLSATASARQLTSTAERFSSVGVTSLLLTKLDEATTFGQLTSLNESTALPLSYTTNGQDVPDDIAVATSERLAELVLGTAATLA